MNNRLSTTIENKIGQLFFIGIDGTEINSENQALLSELQPGGICFFSRNIKTAQQTDNFIKEIHKQLLTKPLISLDEEGGSVDRLRRIVTPLPAASSIRSIKDAATLAEFTVELLRGLGFNMNFAPVVDIIDEHREIYSNGLYSRSFGKSASVVAELTDSYLTTLQNGGCLGCIKHFPGLGASRTDSHEELPVVNLSREELFTVDLYPYQKLIKARKAHAVMVAHATYPLFDLQETDANGKLLPSSLSFNIITNLLRHELGFQGLVISDDLEMGAILKNYGIDDACVMAINAGVDMISICADPNAIYKGFNAVVTAVKTGKIKESRIDESLIRIARIKSLIKPALPLDTNRLAVLSQKIAEFTKILN